MFVRLLQLSALSLCSKGTGRETHNTMYKYSGTLDYLNLVYPYARLSKLIFSAFLQLIRLLDRSAVEYFAVFMGLQLHAEVYEIVMTYCSGRKAVSWWNWIVPSCTAFARAMKNVLETTKSAN